MKLSLQLPQERDSSPVPNDAELFADLFGELEGERARVRRNEAILTAAALAWLQSPEFLRLSR